MELFEVDRSAVRAAIVEDIAAQLAESVAAGEFTQLEADVILVKFQRSDALEQATDNNCVHVDAMLNGRIH